MDRMFPHIRKPLRYIGNEIGSIHKNWDDTEVKFALCYPDVYELGMSNLGIRILYSLINSQPDTLCERVFAPWIDAEEWLRNHNAPLLSLESRTPIKNFDCLGFSLQYELTYTNVLNILDLAKIPIHREKRKEADPLIIAGGYGTLNPAPISKFFDCLFIGEAEPIIPEFIKLLKKWKKEKLKKKELLSELSKLPGFFVPELNNKVKSQITQELKDKDFPSSPILPFLEIERNALSIEIARGCTRGCRFCQAGMVRRPYRERDAKSVLELVKTGIKKTGYQNVSLLSLSASDHSQLLEIIQKIKALKLKVSLPSLRGDALTPEIANLLGKGGITLAPETGTDRLRKVINKDISESQILNSCELVANSGFTHIKLYYMLGLPGEKEKDIDGIIDLTHRIAKIMHHKKVNVALSPFVPRPYTPFQWEAQELSEELSRKINYIKYKFNKRLVKIRYRDPNMSFVEGICARGDEKVSQVIEEAWKLGAKFDGWGNQPARPAALRVSEWPGGFDFSIWEKVFKKLDINPYIYLSEKQENEPLPWDIIDVGVKKEYLLQERNKKNLTLDCRIIGCTECGVCKVGTGLAPVRVPMSVTEPQTISYGRAKKHVILPEAKLRYRVKFEKSEELRFLGHLDLVQAILRAVIRSEIPIAYSKGFRPSPKISFSPPLPFGVTSEEEYFDISLLRRPTGDIKDLLNRTLPKGLQVLEVTPLWGPTQPLFEKFKRCIYKIENVNVKEKRIQEFISKNEIIVHEIDIKPFILSLKKEDNSLILLMKIGKAKPWWVLEPLLKISEDKALDFKIKRTKL
ncbi:TIGR03960 family B12-binding radical SAM protein, partial [candidate division WOR-3 bacterium]|nr:TIGR03960 family B12-binding radical SAM protein [candidate division WOR-3 bacterium]